MRVVSVRLEHVCDVRWLNGEGPLRALDEHAARLEAAVDSREGAARLERILDSPPFATQPGSVTLAAFESTLTDHGLPTERELKSGTTEASVYAEAGIETVVFGPRRRAATSIAPTSARQSPTSRRRSRSTPT